MKWFKRSRKEAASPQSQELPHGLLIFSDTGTVMQAEQILKEENYDVKVVSPPPQYRTGCDLCIDFPLAEEPKIIKLLDSCGIRPIDVLSVSSSGLAPLKLCKTKDFGQYLMVRAANMKITVDKTTKVIVNVSGGGCPDVPYLAYEMVGKSLSEAPAPVLLGTSLCAYSLNTAFEELLRINGGATGDATRNALDERGAISEKQGPLTRAWP